MKTLRRCILTFVATILVGGGIAHATTGTTIVGSTVTAVTATPNVFITTSDGLTTMAPWNWSTCAGAPTVDTVKLWASLAQAALLSGKSVSISWNACDSSGTKWITMVQINQ
jgi:hypothetical protein